jgi:hypothetical protein
MTWRKWMVRGLVFTVLGLMAAGVFVYQAWTNPEAVRRIVLAKIAARCPGAIVTLQSARMQLFGGIAISELRLSRKDDPDQTIVLYVPSAVIYPDKEQVLNGEMRLRKVELNRPHLRILRERDGSLNLKGLFAASDLNERLPLLVVRQGTIVVEDRAASPAPLAEIRDVNLTAVNDPLPVLAIEARGRCDVAGALRGSAHFQRADQTLTATAEAPAIPVGPALVQRLAGICPDLAAHLRQLRGTGRAQASLSYVPGVSQPLHYDVQTTLTGGEFAHARLPWALDQVETSVHCVDGQIVSANVHGRAGAVSVALSLHDVHPPRQGDFVLEDAVREMDWTVEHLAVTHELFAYLPESMRELEESYKPAGQVTIQHRFSHDGDGKAHKSWRILPEGMSGECKYFPDPLHQITGVIEREMTGDKGGVVRINLAAYAHDRPVTIQGEVLGERGRDGVSIDIRGDDVPIDERLHNGLNPYPGTRAIANQFHLRGRVDIQAFLRRSAGGPFANRFLLKFHDTSLKYDQFPLSLDQATGVLEVFPDHWECRDVCGHHQGGEIRVAGRSFVRPTTAGVAGVRLPERMRLSIRGHDVPLDEPFEAALAPADVPGRGPLRHAFKTLRPSGKMDFDAEVVDRNGNPLDMDVAVAVSRASIRPRFFDFAMDEVSGLVHYANQQVTLSDIRARHGAAFLGLKSGQVILKPGGGFQVYMRPPEGSVTASKEELRPVVGVGIVPNDDFLRALPPGIRRGMEALHLRGPFDVATAMVVTVPEPGALPDVWWDGLAWLDDAAVQTGVEMTGIKGEVACQGRYNGQQIEGLLGNVYVEKMNVLGQPLRAVQTRLEVMRGSPDVLRFRDLKAELFGGTIGGQALVHVGGGSSYELVLEAPAIPMEEFGRHNFGGTAELQGPAQVQLFVQGDGSGINSLSGKGSVEVVNGKMYKLPFLLGLLNAIGLRMPDRNAFEQASVHFEINGPQIHVSELELVGNAISLSGQGTLNLDGTNLNLDFTAMWGRLQQMLPTGLNLLPKLVSDQFLKIKVRGKLGDVRYEKELVPGVVEPVKRVLGKN